MLNQLTIRNYVLVDHLDISFVRLNGNYRGIWRWQIDFAVFPKLPMGDRAKAESVRPGTEKADVSAEFAYARVLHCINSFVQTIDASDDCRRSRLSSVLRAVPSVYWHSRHLRLSERRRRALGRHSRSNQHQRLTDHRSATLTNLPRHVNRATEGSNFNDWQASVKSSACRGLAPPRTTAKPR